MPHVPRLMLSRSLAGLLSLLVVTSAGPAGAQEPRSGPVAAELTRLLDAAKLESIAAPDPDDPTTWVAALYFKDAQLLVVSAQYSAPVLLTAKLKEKDYRDIYLALFSSPVAGSKVFVMDGNANGLSLRPGNDDAPDSWEARDTTVTFDGDWRKARISEADYRKAFTDADERYTRMLQALLAYLKTPTSAP